MGYDGTEGARRALDAAAELVGYGSILTVVTVDTGRGPDALSEAHERLLERLITASYVARVGDAADELVAAAHDLEADLLVVGRRSDSESPGVEPGSVSADVVRRAPCDVLVVGRS